MKKAIVIGATSFSGINFTNYLIKKNFEIIGIYSKQSKESIKS
jgi:GDP-D-mannose dehydratase